MLHVIIQPPFDEIDPQCAHFETGQSTASLKPELVLSVIADGAELDLIMRVFEGIPKRFNRHADHDQTSKWFGDDARFIVANWT